MKKIGLLCLILWSGTRLLQAQSPVQQLNQIRESVGLGALVINQTLQKAALAQATYLAAGNPAEHKQIKGYPHFYEKTPRDRALKAGWPTGLVYENFSVGEPDHSSSLAELMAAIYHRQVFLKPELDQVGYAEAGQGERASYVYLLSSSLAAEACIGGSKQTPCATLDPLNPEEYHLATEAKLKATPRWVGWPGPALSVLPVFYEEQPDPLPDQAVSGYPISFELNPALLNGALTSVHFAVSRLSGGPVEPLLVMDQTNDPNHRFGPTQFAFFPKHRLQWGGVYQASFQAKVGGRLFEVRWKFKVQSSHGTLVKIKAAGEWLRLAPEQSYSLYLAPEPGQPFLGDMEATQAEGLRLQLGFEDKNTLNFFGSGRPCARIHFTLDRGRTFHVLLAKPGGETYFETPPVCYPPALQGLRGYRLASGLQLPIDQPFFILLPEQRTPSEGFSWDFEPGLEVQAKQVSENLLQVQLFGPNGGAVRLISAEGEEYNFMLSTKPSPFELFAPRQEKPSP